MSQSKPAVSKRRHRRPGHTKPDPIHKLVANISRDVSEQQFQELARGRSQLNSLITSTAMSIAKLHRVVRDDAQEQQHQELCDQLDELKRVRTTLRSVTSVAEGVVVLRQCKLITLR